MEKYSHSAVRMTTVIPVLFACLWFTFVFAVHTANFDVATDGELRNAISNANDSDTITFAVGITLVDPLP